MATEQDVRIEHDSMGEVRVPAHAKWRAQTQRAVENFPISGTPIERELIGALAAVKGAAAQVNAELGVLPRDIADAVSAAAAEVARGDWDSHFPIDVFQTGSGTSSNMNTNEVIATLATMLGTGAPLDEALVTANRAGGIVVGKLGTATVTREELFPG